MKKFLALLLALMMVFSLAACGGSDEPDPSEPSNDPVVSEPAGESGTGLTDMDGTEVSEETLAALTEAYNALAVPFNEIATAANENGWAADEQTLAELDALGATLGFIGTALTDDLSMLDGTDFDALIEKLETEFPDALNILAERVSYPYGEG